jgi:hypothetical protein
MSRAQLSMTAVEAALGVVLVTSIAVLFALGVPGADDATAEAQLDTYAEDAGVLLANEPPQHLDQTRLSEVTSSPTAFERERDTLERRIERILPENLLFRVETEYGTVGQPLPDGVTTGETTVLTTNGEVTLRVWYA